MWFYNPELLKGKTFHEICLILTRYSQGDTKIIESFETHKKLIGEGTSNVPNIKWEDVGGLNHAKHDIL